MQETFLKLYAKMQCVKHGLSGDDRGQDLIEYALVVSLIALAATVSMSAVASSISTAFSKVGSKMAVYTS
jgi:pilus assembly protein Flp/PilA